MGGQQVEHVSAFDSHVAVLLHRLSCRSLVLIHQSRRRDVVGFFQLLYIKLTTIDCKTRIRIWIINQPMMTAISLVHIHGSVARSFETGSKNHLIL